MDSPTKHHGIVFVALLCLGVMFPAALQAASCDTPSDGAQTYRFPRDALSNVASRGILGGSTMYKTDDDAFWGRGAGVDSVRKAGLRTLRFPGGTVADNYDWETNRLVRPDEFPREDGTDAERDSRTDYLEFLAAARKAGVEDVFFVVNVDSAFRSKGDQETNLRIWAKKAARWVKAVKSAGYKVRHWEIGNEMYLANNPTTVAEYAKALKIYAAAMRAADPEILIGAVGPLGFGDVGVGDEIGEEAVKAIRAGADSHGAKACADTERRKACMKRFEREASRGGPAAPWWPTLLEEAGASFDFAVVHRYRPAKFPQGKGGAFPATRQLISLRTSLQEAKGRPVPVALTEWNIPGDVYREGRTDQIGHLSEVAILLGNNAVGGVDFAHYWPFRILAGNNIGALLRKDGSSGNAARLFSAASGVVPGQRVSEAALSADLYALRVGDATTKGAIIVNRGARGAKVVFEGVTGRSSITLFSQDAGGAVIEEICERDKPGVGGGFDVPANSVMVVGLR